MSKSSGYGSTGFGSGGMSKSSGFGSSGFGSSGYGSGAASGFGSGAGSRTSRPSTAEVRARTQMAESIQLGMSDRYLVQLVVAGTITLYREPADLAEEIKQESAAIAADPNAFKDVPLDDPDKPKEEGESTDGATTDAADETNETETEGTGADSALPDPAVDSMKPAAASTDANSN